MPLSAPLRASKHSIRLEARLKAGSGGLLSMPPATPVGLHADSVFEPSASPVIQLLAQTKSLSSKLRSADHRDKLRSLAAGFTRNL